MLLVSTITPIPAVVYPNVINEIINLSLSNGATLGEGEQVVNLPNEFIEQFKTGQAKEIDTAICAKTDGCNEARWFSLTTRNVNEGQIQGVINKLWGVDKDYKSVTKFHVFHDSTNFYGSTGNARGQAVVNISNAAFPILMARNDKNYWLAFGEKRAWDKNELAYITEAPSIVRPENVTRETATFNLPFISLGQVGDGKLMVIGNPHYNSILRCPNGYSWNGGVNKDGQCTLNSDPDDMKNFIENVLRYLSNDRWLPDAKSNMTVGTNLDTVYFKKHGQVTGNSAAFGFHPDFAGISVEHLSSYGDLDPQEMPLLILNGFEYVTQVGNDPYAIPLRADTSKPKLTQQDVTDLIAYMNKGGSVLIMENVMSNLKEESASGFVRLLDAAGLSMALNKSVVNNDPQGYWLAGLLGLLVLGQRLLKNPAMRLRWDKTLLRLPVIGRVARGLNTARFSRTLSILTASSVPLLEGIQTAAAVSANRYVEQQLLLAADRVREGSSLRAALAELRLFPPMMLYMIASGEQSGELETMLEQAAVNQEREFDTQVGLALGLFEPALVVMMAGVVLFIVIAILEPMLQLNNMVGM